MHILIENTATMVTSAMTWDSPSHTNRVLYAYVGWNIVLLHLAYGSDDWSIFRYNAFTSSKYLLKVYRSVVP